MSEIEELQNIIFSIDNIIGNTAECANKVQRYEQDLKDHRQQLDKYILHKQFYKKAIDIIYMNSLTELKDILNSALEFIFDDKNLQMDIELTDKRGKSLNFIIKQNGKKVSLKTGMGMGVKCVISCILHIYYLQCKGSKILMLDEAYSNISEEYVANFFEFISKLCKRLHFKLILITHDKRFKDYADKLYKVNNGVVTEDEK